MTSNDDHEKSTLGKGLIFSFTLNNDLGQPFKGIHWLLTYHELELVTGTAGAPPPPPPPGIRKNLSIFARHQPEPFVITTISSAAIVLTISAGHCAACGALLLYFRYFIWRWLLASGCSTARCSSLRLSMSPAQNFHWANIRDEGFIQLHSTKSD